MLDNKLKLILLIAICILFSGCTIRVTKVNKGTVGVNQSPAASNSGTEITDKSMPANLSPGQIISVPEFDLVDYTIDQTDQKDVNGDKVPDYIFLIFQNNEPFIDSYLIMKDGASGKIYQIEDGDDETFMANVSLQYADVNGDKTDDIILCQDYGGNGGGGIYGFSIYSFKDNIGKSLGYDVADFKAIINKDNKLVVDYEPLNYQETFDAYESDEELLPIECLADVAYDITPVDFGNSDYKALRCMQYVSGYSRGDFVGEACSTIKYNTSTEKWDIVAFEFLPADQISQDE